MTDLRQAAQQALDALKAMQSYAADEHKGLRICDESITALEAALAAPQPQPQPVVWMTHHNSVALMPLFHHDKASALSWGDGDQVPLYAHPPQRQPLTDEEINALELPGDGTGTVRDFVRAIEAAHGIGGDK
jgi:hypothetical protein